MHNVINIAINLTKDVYKNQYVSRILKIRRLR